MDLILTHDAITGRARADNPIRAMAAAHEAKLWDKVIAVGEAWVEARNGMSPVAAMYYAQALMATGQLEEAEKWAVLAANRMPEREKVAVVAARAVQAAAHARLGRWHKARLAMQQMVSADLHVSPEQMTPDIHDALCDAKEKQGHVKLALGHKHWRDAWQQMEARLDIGGRNGLPTGVTRWDGKTPGKIAVIHEQGIGDGLLFARWVPWLAKASGARPRYYGPPVLQRWMAEMPGIDFGDERAFNPADTDAACLMMSLPALAGVSHPADVPLPWAPPSLRTLRDNRPPSDGMRVGVCWEGSVKGWHDFERSYSAADFSPIWAPLEGVTFQNLQHRVEVPDNAPFGAVDFPDIYAAGEAVAQCDLVITVDTAIAHLAGSLNVPTITLVPTVADWRYQWPRGGDTPFYPQMLVVRRNTARSLSAITKARWMLERLTRHRAAA